MVVLDGVFETCGAVVRAPAMSSVFVRSDFHEERTPLYVPPVQDHQ